MSGSGTANPGNELGTKTREIFTMTGLWLDDFPTDILAVEKTIVNIYPFLALGVRQKIVYRA